MNEARSFRPDPNAPAREVANQRFKRSFSSLFWASITAATTLHFAAFAYLPPMAVANVGFDATPTEVVNIPPDIVVPPPPEAIRRPARPVINPVALDDILTIPPNTDHVYAPDLPPPPAAADTRNLPQQPGFVVHTVRPKMLNPEEVDRVLQREYPALLKDAGIGGTTTVHLFIDEEGNVRDQLVKVGSGHAGLDAAALKVVTVARFSPARNRDKPVALWIELEVTFKANQQSTGR